MTPRLKTTLDFLVIGAQKSGTTSLFEYLRCHPEICIPAGKEVPYFSHEAARSRGWYDYLAKNFPFADPEQRWGTVTTHYMFGTAYDELNRPIADTTGSLERVVPARIRGQMPDVKLVAILRDPVDRAYSHYLMTSLTGLEQRSFDDAVDALLDTKRLVHSRQYPEETNAYVVWGEYGRLLKGYLDVFPRDQLLVVFTSDLERRPHDVLRRIYTFVGVDPNFAPSNVETKYRVGASAPRLQSLTTYGWASPYAMQRLAARTNAIRVVWHSLPQTVRRRIDMVFADAAYRMDLWNRRGDALIASPTPDTLQRLRTHFSADGTLLYSLLKFAPPWLHDEFTHGT